jgi:hypothetical protein
VAVVGNNNKIDSKREVDTELDIGKLVKQDSIKIDTTKIRNNGY